MVTTRVDRAYPPVTLGDAASIGMRRRQAAHSGGKLTPNSLPAIMSTSPIVRRKRGAQRPRSNPRARSPQPDRNRDAFVRAPAEGYRRYRGSTAAAHQRALKGRASGFGVREPARNGAPDAASSPCALLLPETRAFDWLEPCSNWRMATPVEPTQRRPRLPRLGNHSTNRLVGLRPRTISYTGFTRCIHT